MRFSSLVVILAIVLSACSVITNNINTTNNTGSDAMIKRPVVRLETNKGTIVIELYNDTLPITAGNFLKLVDEGFYNGTIFHRVIKDFMIQGGDPTGFGSGGPGYTIPDEFTEDNANLRGTISMANAGPGTGGSQFFINVVDNNYLNDKHPVFGRVIQGIDVVDAISIVPTDSNNRPLDDVILVRAVQE